MNLRDMLTGDVNRLRYITRYSTSLVLHRENVAEHSYYVTLYAMFLCRWVKVNLKGGMLPDEELAVLRRCLLHDLDEARTGDFQRPFKYRRPKLKKLMEDAAEEEFREAIESIFPEDGAYVGHLCMSWAGAKDDSRAGLIVAFADYLSVISHLYAEVSCANVSVMQHYKSLCEYSHKFDGEQFDFVRPLVDQCRDLFKEMMELANLNIDLERYDGEL